MFIRVFVGFSPFFEQRRVRTMLPNPAEVLRKNGSKTRKK